MLGVRILRYQQVLFPAELENAKLCCRGSKRSRILDLAVHGEFIYYRTYNSVGLNKGSQFSRCGRANSRLPMKKI